MSEILPCPKCGTKPFWRNTFEHPNLFTFRCPHFEVRKTQVDAAAEAWNYTIIGYEAAAAMVAPLLVKISAQNVTHGHRPPRGRRVRAPIPFDPTEDE